MKMYNTPKSQGPITQKGINPEKRIEELEEQVVRLTEELNRLKNLERYNNRAVKRHNSAISALSSSLRNRY